MAQRGIPAVYMRGGTSRALMFHAAHLPPPGPERDGVLCAALGSPDPHRRQLDGMGGGTTSLSKVAVIGPPSHPAADVDYTFGQVDVTQPLVLHRGNCGNISAAVGPFAVDEGLVRAAEGAARVMIHNTNTGKLIEARFGVTDGRADVGGGCVIAGVAGGGAPIELAFLQPGGAATGALLPTGRMRDTLHVAGRTVEASIVDAANPTVFVHAAALGLTGTEAPADLAADGAAMTALRALRTAAALAAGLIADPAEAQTVMRNLPLVCVLASAVEPADGPPRIRVRMFNADQPHAAAPLTGAMCAAVAARLPGTLVADVVRRSEDPRLIVEHPSGDLPVAAVVRRQNGRWVAHEAVVQRTARRLMDGRVYVPEGRRA